MPFPGASGIIGLTAMKQAGGQRADLRIRLRGVQNALRAYRPCDEWRAGVPEVRQQAIDHSVLDIRRAHRQWRFVERDIR